MHLKRFPRSGFFNFGNKSKAGGLMSGLYGGWGSTCHPYCSKISDTAPEAWGCTLMYDRWPLRKVWLQSVPSSISKLRFAEQDHVACQYTHTVLFTEVWLTAVAKIRTIASSYWPRKRSVQNFWNDLHIIRCYMFRPFKRASSGLLTDSVNRCCVYLQSFCWLNTSWCFPSRKAVGLPWRKRTLSDSE